MSSTRSIETEPSLGAALQRVCSEFVDVGAALEGAVEETTETVPAPFDQLLCHSNHMTTTLGGFFGVPVCLRVLREQRTDTHYCREILLTAGPEGPVVEFGIARVNFGCAPDAVREEILEKQTPLGDILIAHQVLRTIRPLWFLEAPKGSLVRYFGTDGPAHGRVGTIYFHNEPAIELLEVVMDRRADLGAAGDSLHA